MQATLSAPLTLNPAQATVLQIDSVRIDPAAQSVTIRYRLVDAGGNVLDRQEVTANSPGVQTWVGNQMATIYNALLTKLGLSATVA